MCSNAKLAERVTETSKGQFRLIDTAERGRCLEAAVDLIAGQRIQDLPVLPHGSSLGRHLAEAAGGSGSQAEEVKSVEMLAALDFLSSLALALAELAESGGFEKELLMSLYQFPEAPPRVPMIRRWHKKWRPDVAAAVAVPFLEQAWAHVVPNWRQLTVSRPCWRWIETTAGAEASLSHDVVCGLWLHMALCEHSCDPNCALIHDGESLWFTALRPISAGSPITTSYLSTGALLRPQPQRQEELREGWGFDCACDRCSEETGRVAEASPSESPSDLEALLQSCSSPPQPADSADCDSARRDYCEKLQALQEKVRELHGRFCPSPAELALLLLESIFAPTEKLRECASERHCRACQQLFGNTSSYAQWSLELFRCPESCFEGNGNEESHRTALRDAYARHFASRQWARRRRGAEYVAWKAAATSDAA